ncbi:MAG: hypothetical protein AABW57_00325 [Nanoarchaeota archaeon]
MEDNLKKELTKEEREKINEQEKLNLINKEKTKKTRKRILFYSIAFIIIVSLVYYGIYTSAQPGKYDDFAKCLTENDVKEYGAFWCPKCAEQKKMFEKSFKYVTYIECDARGDNAQPELCQEKNIRGYPTWIINDSLKYEGVQSLERLSQYSGCKLNS